MKPDFYADLLNTYVQAVRLFQPYLEHFPRHERFGLTKRIQTTVYDLHDDFIEAKTRRKNTSALTSMEINLEKLKFQFRLADELGMFRYKQSSVQNDPYEAHRRYYEVTKRLASLEKLIRQWIQSEGN